MTAMNEKSVYPRVGIVILNWNKRADTVACIESLGRIDYPSFEVVVVDNGSEDGSQDLIRQRFPGVRLIENGRNLGFAAGNNVGIDLLMTGGADYVLLLNNDTEVACDFLGSLVAVGETRPEIAVLGPKIYYYAHPDLVWSAGGRIDRFGQPVHLHVDQVDRSPDEGLKDVDYVTGCAILVKRGAIQRVGMLDERFFMYFEEAEWCARARRAGFRVVYVPRARIWHKIEQSARNTSRRYQYLMTRNRLLYLKCTGASASEILFAGAGMLRGIAASSFRTNDRRILSCYGPVLLGMRDFALGRFGAPPAML